MVTTETKQETNWLTAALPVIVDGLTAVALLIWLPGLAQRLIEPSGWNALLLVVLYVLFCIGVYLSRKLLPQPGRWPPPDWLMNPKVRGLLGLVFALLMTTTFAYQLGYFRAIFDLRAGLLEEGSTAAFLVYAPGAWLGFSLLVILVLAFPVNASIAPENGRYALVALLSLVLTNGLLLFTAGQTRAMMEGLGLTPGLGAALLVLLALVLSFFPARMHYQSRQPHLLGWLSYTVLLVLVAILGAGI